MGEGGFAKCYEFSNLDSKRVQAAKIIPKSRLEKKDKYKKL